MALFFCLLFYVSEIFSNWDTFVAFLVCAIADKSYFSPHLFSLIGATIGLFTGILMMESKLDFRRFFSSVVSNLMLLLLLLFYCFIAKSLAKETIEEQGIDFEYWFYS